MRQTKSIFIRKLVLLMFIFAIFIIHFYMLYDQIHYLKTSKIAGKWSEYKISIDKLQKWINYLELKNKINIFKYSIFQLVVWFGQNILSEQIMNKSILQKILYLIYVFITIKFDFIFFLYFLVMNGLLPSFGIFLACFPIWFFYKKFKIRATLHIMLSYLQLIESIFIILFKNQFDEYITLIYKKSNKFENLTNDHFINISNEEKKKIYELISAHKITKMYIEYKDDLNAFSIGLKKEKIVAITDLILKKLNFSELYFVIGHELGHIFHNDTTKKYKILIMQNVFLFGGHILIYFTFLEKNDIFYMVFCFEIFKNVFSTFYEWITNYLILHNLEYAADEYGKKLLSKIENDFTSNSNFSATNMFLKMLENNGFAKFDMKFLYSLNFSHPSILKRIEKLKF